MTTTLTTVNIIENQIELLILVISLVYSLITICSVKQSALFSAKYKFINCTKFWFYVYDNELYSIRLTINDKQ